MAQAAIINLFPPIVDTFQPAFVYNDKKTSHVAFAISPFNLQDVADITCIHVSVTRQDNNQNAIKEINYIPNMKNTNNTSDDTNYIILNGILIMFFPHEDSPSDYIVYDEETDLYVLRIPSAALVDESFSYDTFYKVQLRVANNGGKSLLLPDNGPNSDTSIYNTYLMTYRPYFSEWSTVTLIRPIPQYKFVLPKFEDRDIKNNGLLELHKGSYRISAKFYFPDPDDENKTLSTEEHLSKYRIRVYEEDDIKIENTISSVAADAKPVVDSGIVYSEVSPITSSKTQVTTQDFGINYLLDFLHLTWNKTYYFVFDLWTNNGFYTQEGPREKYSFKIAEWNSQYNKPRWNSLNWVEEDSTEHLRDVVVNQEDGIVKIDMSWEGSGDKMIPTGWVYFKRASSKDNFKTWDLVHVVEKTKSGNFNYIWEDYTVSSMLKYKYSMQFEAITNNEAGQWSEIYESNYVYPKFYDMLIERQNRQIAIRYNGQVSSWKPNVNRQKIDTLGGRYPRFVENAQMKYTSFQISGLITAEEDFNRKFLSEFDGEWELDEDGNPIGDFQYYYKSKIDDYNSELDGKYILRNDTAIDGEIGYNSKLDKNEYLNNKDLYRYYQEDKTYSHSIFHDSLDAFSSDSSYQHDSTLFENWYWEREFRNQLIDWLNDGEPKLYRSMPEGNMAVMITDVSLTPNAQMGRRTYNFSATLYEVGDGYDLSVLDSLGIIDIPKKTMNYSRMAIVDKGSSSANPSDSINQYDIGQFYKTHLYKKSLIRGNKLETAPDSSDTYQWDEMSVIEQFERKYDSYLKNINKDTFTETCLLTDVKIQFLSKPRWYKYDSLTNAWLLVNIKDEEDTISLKNWQEDNIEYFLGYRFWICQLDAGSKLPSTIEQSQILEVQTNLNNETFNETTDNQITTINSRWTPVLVNAKGYYQVPSGTYISDIWLSENDEAIIDYLLYYSYQYDMSDVPTQITTKESIVGQWYGMYLANTSVTADIHKKYEYYDYAVQNNSTKIQNKNTYSKYRYLDTWKGFSLDVSPYTVAHIKYEDNNNYTTVLVGRTGVFSILQNANTEDIVFTGRRMFKQNKELQPYLDEWEFVVEEAPQAPDTPTGGAIGTTNWLEGVNNLLVNTDTSVQIYIDSEIMTSEDGTELIAGAPHDIFLQWQDLAEAQSAYGIYNPQYNTVYQVQKTDGSYEWYIYYIDGKWYPIQGDPKNEDVILALVPVYGYLNYSGNIIERSYDVA